MIPAASFIFRSQVFIHIIRSLIIQKLGHLPYDIIFLLLIWIAEEFFELIEYQHRCFSLGLKQLQIHPEGLVLCRERGYYLVVDKGLKCLFYGFERIKCFYFSARNIPADVCKSKSYFYRLIPF